LREISRVDPERMAAARRELAPEPLDERAVGLPADRTDAEARFRGADDRCGRAVGEPRRELAAPGREGEPARQGLPRGEEHPPVALVSSVALRPRLGREGARELEPAEESDALRPDVERADRRGPELVLEIASGPREGDVRGRGREDDQPEISDVSPRPRERLACRLEREVRRTLPGARVVADRDPRAALERGGGLADGAALPRGGD